MRLDQYLAEQKLSQAEFGNRLTPPVTQGAVSQWIVGSTRISLHRAFEIQKATGGVVSAQDCADMYVEKEAAA